MTQLGKKGIRYSLLNDQDVSGNQLKKDRILFLHTTELNHIGTVSWLANFLGAR